MSKSSNPTTLANPLDGKIIHIPESPKEQVTPKELLAKYRDKAVTFAQQKAWDYEFAKFGINDAEVESCAQQKCWHCAQRHNSTRGEFEHFMRFSIKRALLSLLGKRMVELGIMAGKIFTEIAESEDCEDESDFLLHLADDEPEVQRRRRRTIRTFQAVIDAKAVEDVEKALPDKKDRLSKTDLLSEVEIYVLKECGTEKTAEEISQQEKSQEYGLKTKEKVSNKFVSAFNRLWRIFEKLGYHWLDRTGTFRGDSLKEWDKEVSDVQIRDPRLLKKTVMQALMQLYGMPRDS
jgi:hypothetical protein